MNDIAENKISRCPWCGDDPLYVQYHDQEWGRPVTDNIKLFELLSLEGAQAGLSWLTILRKRENYRKAFCGFDFHKIAQMTSADAERLTMNEGIVRNKLKINSVIVNAGLFEGLIDEFGSFYNYVISFFPEGKRIVNNVCDVNDIAVVSPISCRMSKDLKKRGFKFVGPTVCYSFLQAAGFIDDHLNSCSFKSNPL